MRLARSMGFTHFRKSDTVSNEETGQHCLAADEEAQTAQTRLKTGLTMGSTLSNPCDWLLNI